MPSQFGRRQDEAEQRVVGGELRAPVQARVRPGPREHRVVRRTGRSSASSRASHRARRSRRGSTASARTSARRPLSCPRATARSTAHVLPGQLRRLLGRHLARGRRRRRRGRQRRERVRRRRRGRPAIGRRHAAVGRGRRRPGPGRQPAARAARRRRTATAPRDERVPSLLALAPAERLDTGGEHLDDAIDVVDAAAPGAAARLLQRRPQARVVGQLAVRRQLRVRRARRQQRAPPPPASSSRPPAPTRLTRPSSVFAVDHDLDRRRRRRSLPIGPPASASGPTWPMQAPVETPEKRASVTSATCLAPRDELERRRELVGLFHPGAERPAPISTMTSPALTGVWPPCPLIAAIASRLGDEHARRPAVAVDAVGVDDRRIDRRRLDHRALGREVAATGTPPCWSGPRARAASALMITSSGSTPSSDCSRARASRRRSLVLPPVEHRAQRLARHGQHVGVQQPHPAQVQHHLGHAAGHEHLHGRMIARAVGQRVHQPRRRSG